MSMTTTMNADLQRERAQATFSVERLTHMLDGGPEKTKRRRQLEAIIAKDPTGIFSNQDNHYLHRTDRHVRALAKHVRLVELARKLGIGEEEGGQLVLSDDWTTLYMAMADDMPTALHWIMFVPNIISLCDEEQKAKWLPLCRDWRIMGCYAQTELGHGSNIRALETTATFVQDSGDGHFVIHSPTLTSAKFWPGTLGRTANHAMVIARLIDGDGVDRGIHNFIVPLRCPKTHKLRKGVTTGDIGPKIGYNNMDNGFARFDHVVIPRRNMAMRFAKVDKRGKYQVLKVSDAASKIAYITMMQVRAYIVNEAGRALATACTISIRYSAVRRQGYESEGSKKEVQVLDYKQQQHRLLPLLAASYCFFFTGKQLMKRLNSVEAKLQQSQPVTKAQVADIHASSSSLKSFSTTVAADGMEDCRKACGGHGYLQGSGLPELVNTFLMNPTVEGDNQMLPQQVVKVLLKLVQAVQSNKGLEDYTNTDSILLLPSLQAVLQGKQERCTAQSKEDLFQLPVLLEAFRHRAARLLVEVALQLQKAIQKGQAFEQAWNTALVQMARVSRAYSTFLLFNNFVDGIEQESILEEAERQVLEDLACLFGLYWIEREIGDFLEDMYLTRGQVAWVRSCVLQMLDKVRVNSVALVDARDISDFRLKSHLGRYDGNVYPHIMEAALRDPLNQTEPGPGYQEHLRRLYVDGVGVYTGTASRL